jgi:sugar lactone lactonase YvrE
VNAPQSKRFAKFHSIRWSRQRLECGGLSTAFRDVQQGGIEGNSFPKIILLWTIGASGDRMSPLREGESMKIKTLIGLATIAVVFSWQAVAQTYDTNGDYVQTFAGSGFSGYVDGVGQQTMFNNPNTIVADSHGNLFVWDSQNSMIRKIAPDSTVTTFSGGGNQTTGIGTNVNLPNNLSFGGMTIDRNDTIWAITFPSSVYLYKITSNATVTRTSISLSDPLGICADSYDNLYISDQAYNKIYRYDTNGALTVFAGSGNPTYADGNGIFTAFYFPRALATDAANNIYVWDSGNYLIRKIDQSQNVTTFAGKYQINNPITDGIGTNASLHSISGMCFDSFGNLIFTDSALATGSSVRKISPTTNVVTLAGSFAQNSYTNGAGNLARFNEASGVCVSGGTIYVADTSNQRIRSITNNPVAQPVLPANLQLNTYPGLQIIGMVGRTYQIQTSPDLNSWATKATILLNSSPYLWIDQNPLSGNKFYRALLLP